MAHFDRAIPPGGEGKVTLTIDLKGFQGPVWKSATIFSNDPQNPMISLNFYVTVRPHIEILPSHLVQFKGTKEEEQEKEVDLKTTSLPFKILRTENTLGEKMAYKLETIRKEKHYRLKVINRQKMERYSGMLTFFTNHPKIPEIKILIRFIP